jgi:uncharacterized membrane protein
MSASTSTGLPACPAAALTGDAPHMRPPAGSPLGQAGVACWKLGRNCSMAPAQFAAVYGALAGVSLAVALFFWVQGARMVMPFACLELAAVGVAFWVHARHTGDAEWITVQDGRLFVQRCHGGRWSRDVFDAAWVEVGVCDDAGQLVRLRSGGRAVQVGRWVRMDKRRVFAHELRALLAGRQPPARHGFVDAGFGFDLRQK